jgi:hypothetical protein
MARPLFDDMPIVDALVDRRRKLAEAIAELPRDVLLTRGLDDLTAGLVAFFRLDPLVLNWGKKSFDPNSIDAGVGDGVNRGISEFIPFSGAPGLFLEFGTTKDPGPSA